MTSAPRLRRYHPDDQDAASRALARCITEAFKDLIPAPALAVLTETRMRERLSQNHKASTWLLEDGNEIVGIGQIAADEITFLYLRQTHVGQDLGHLLMQRLQEDARAAGLSSVRLWCLETNSRARRFYDRQGALTGRRRDILLAGHALPHLEYEISVAPAPSRP